MPDSAVLQVLIGLALVFAVFSVAVSRVNETVLGFLNYRGRQLEAELRRLASENVERDPALPAEPDSPDGSTVGQSIGAVRDLTAELLDGPLRGLRTGGRPSVPAVGVRGPSRPSVTSGRCRSRSAGPARTRPPTRGRCRATPAAGR
ncbi:hypothetical protein [Pseudofrankia sp. DC12]|uniref:hypothetical protein n=1 Tax=Pseudofrankia sp. DC12 TaxID=683315 RepID=UPI001E2D2376|nr:hypothetical protein [Pseudofrankia sp. DC12]